MKELPSPVESIDMAGENQQAKTLYDKLWDDHLVKQRDDGSALLYIDRHLLHEVTSPQAFEGLQLAGRKPWRLSANVATPDHNVPTSTKERSEGIAGIEDDTSRIQVQTLDDNCKTFNVVQFDINDVRQGIAHVVGPEQGLTLPGMTVVCGDSHTATHGAFGCLAHGIVEILLEIESSGANIGLAVAFGMFGNTLYRHHVDQQIAKTRQLGSGSVNTELENRGGTNIVAGSILLVIWLGLVALAISAS
jgi:hypothetical protein